MSNHSHRLAGKDSDTLQHLPADEQSLEKIARAGK